MHPVGSPTGSSTVAGLGQCSLDYLCVVDAFPVLDVKCEFREFSIQGGGPVATALVALARWGLTTRFVGLVGNDSFGRSILNELEKEKVDASATVIRHGTRSQFAFICVDATTGKRTIFWGRPDAGGIVPKEIPEDFLDSVQALHLDGLYMEASIHVARLARKRGIPVVLDAGSYRGAGMADLMGLVDHLIASESFAEQFAPTQPLPDLLRDLKRLGPKVVAVTLGERGCVALWKDEPLWLPAPPIPAKDTTGAGDVFHGAYIDAFLRGWPTEDRFRWATAAASLSCLSLGGRTGIPSHAHIEEALVGLQEFREACLLDPKEPTPIDTEEE